MISTRELGWEMRKSPLASMIFLLGGLWIFTPVVHRILHYCPLRPDGIREAEAMPQWARKYGVSCSVCHTTVPRLTPAGYRFRRAGFRMPDEYGQDAKFTGLKDMYTARIRQEFRINGKTGGASPTDSSKFAFHELTFYPVTGAFGKWWAAESELTFNPGETVEVENAYVRATYPYEKDWLFTARGGIFHPFEGYGGSDRAISNIRPLILTEKAKNGTFDTLVKTFTQDQQGLELGATWKDTTMSLAILNGFNTTKGAANEGDDNNDRDYLLFFNQLIGDRAGVSAEFLKGVTSFKFDGSAGTQWDNRYTRSAVYANYNVLKEKLNLLGGYQAGKDYFPNPANTADTTGAFGSNGFFAEAESKLHERFTGGLRFDTYTPNTDAGNNRISALTLTGVVPFDEIKFLVDYQRKKTQQTPPVDDQLEDIWRLEWMMIF